MALPADFSKIYGSTATGGLTPISDVNYAKGWEFVGSNPPTKNDFSYLQNLSDLKSQWLHSNKLQRKDPFGDIKADGAVQTALANLGLGGAASKNVGTTAGTVAAGDDSRIVNAVQLSNPGLCTAWVNFNGNNPATIRSSFNVSSVTRLSTGKYQIIFGTPMKNPDYAVSLTIGDGATSGTAAPIVAINGSSTTGDPVKKDAVGINITTRGSGGVYECSEVNAIFFGGK